MSSGSARLKHAMKTLNEHWELTKESWDDVQSRDFEKNHIAPVDHQVTTAIRGMDKIHEVLVRVRQECS
jgi:hypothetical protein